jgi:hypothetical protein
MVGDFFSFIQYRNASDVANMETACGHFGDDVQTAGTRWPFAPAPVDTEWKILLQNFRTGVNYCENNLPVDAWNSFSIGAEQLNGLITTVHQLIGP